MIVDASVVIDAVADNGARGDAARESMAGIPADEPAVAPGHFAIEVLSGLRAVANRPGNSFRMRDIPAALADAEALGVQVESTHWVDIRRAWGLAAGSLRYTDAVYVAAAERHGTVLLTADARIARSGAPIGCVVRTVAPAGSSAPADDEGFVP